MVASVLVGMLCAHLLCFAVMFLLISKRLHGQKMGMDLFALGNFLLGSAYVLHLLEGGPAWSAMSVVNHTLTLASPVVYWLGAMRFLGTPSPCCLHFSYLRRSTALRRYWCNGAWGRLHATPCFQGDRHSCFL